MSGAAQALRSKSKLWFLLLISKGEAATNYHYGFRNENRVHSVSICWASTCYAAPETRDTRKNQKMKTESDNNIKGEKREGRPCLFHRIALVTIKHYLQVNERQIQNHLPPQRKNKGGRKNYWRNLNVQITSAIIFHS